MPNNPDEHFPDFDPIFDYRTTCSKEEAVAKLLGFMRGHIRHEYPEDDSDITIEHLTYTHSLGHPLDLQLSILKEAALSRLSDAITAKSPEDVLNELTEAVVKCDELSNKAGGFLCRIDAELAKGEASALQIDSDATEKVGETQITISSLDLWAREKYGIYILTDALTINKPEQQELSSAAQKSLVGNKHPAKKQPKLQAQQDAILNEIVKLKYDPKSLPKFMSNKPGVKSEVNHILNGKGLFTGKTVFDKAWERLRKYGDIADMK